MGLFFILVQAFSIYYDLHNCQTFFIVNVS